MKFLQIIKSIFILSVLSALVSCGSSSGGSSGRVSLLITDGPADFDQINLTLQSVSFIGPGSENNNGHETILFKETRVINLLALQNFSELLATIVIPVGTYNKIRLHVSQVELVKADQEPVIAKLPANGKIDLNPQGPFNVTADGPLIIELDVDAEKSIHIVETGSEKYIFRPVVFVNILGQEKLKLVILDGKALAKTVTGFQLCEVEALVVNSSCLAVLISDNTVVQDKLIDDITTDGVQDGDIVTVLGKMSGAGVYALHIVTAKTVVETQSLALFTGKAASNVNADNFSMTTDDDNDVVPAGTSLSVTLANKARIFDKYGVEVGSDKIDMGTDVDVFGLAQPDLASVTDVKAAFVIFDNDIDDYNITGTIVDISGSQIIVTVVDGSVTVNKCVDISDADIFLLNTDAESMNSTEININDLHSGMSVDIYGENKAPCMSADVVIVTGN